MDGSSRSGSRSVMITADITASTLEYHNMFMIYLHKHSRARRPRRLFITNLVRRDHDGILCLIREGLGRGSNDDILMHE